MTGGWNILEFELFLIPPTEQAYHIRGSIPEPALSEISACFKMHLAYSVQEA
jgi:hypothetical protein